MELLVLLFMLPGFIIFDIIPSLFKYKGLTDWYCDKYKTEADNLIPLYIVFSIILIAIIYFLNI